MDIDDVPRVETTDTLLDRDETDLLVVPVTPEAPEDEESDNPQMADLRAALDLDLAEWIEAEDFDGEPGETLLLQPVPGVAARRLLLVGLGRSDDEVGSARRALGRAGRRCASLNAPRVTVLVPGEPPTSSDVRQIVEGYVFGAYDFDRYRSEDGDDGGLGPLTLVGSGTTLERDAAEARAVAAGVVRARNLANEPALEMTPEEIASRAEEIAISHDLDSDIFEERELRERGFDLIDAVGRGSEQPPRLIHLTYRPAAPAESIAFVGKGVTFDSGGYNMKGTDQITNMHFDMGGGAAVLGAAEAVGRLQPESLECHFVVPAAENAVSGDAIHPQDIIRGYGDRTVQIENTDAEGRLLLADALSYIQEHQVDTIVDLATLTGSCVVALGPTTGGLFTDDETMRSELLEAGERGGEDLWPLPLNRDLEAQLDSDVADVTNVGSRWGGAITAALFLDRWVDIDRWAHIDMAGPAFSSDGRDYHAPGGTGFGVTTSIEFLRTMAE